MLRIWFLVLSMIWIECNVDKHSQHLMEMQGSRCKIGSYRTMRADYVSELHSCSECSDILDVLVNIEIEESRYGQSFQWTQILCLNYILHEIALLNISVGELFQLIEDNRRNVYMFEGGYTVEFTWHCNESSSICLEGRIQRCKEGYLPLFEPPLQGLGIIMKCIRRCDYGLFIPAHGGCYPGYCEEGILTINIPRERIMNVCQFGDEEYMGRGRKRAPDWTYMNGSCTSCDQPEDFWAFTTFLDDSVHSLQTSLCGFCPTWAHGMPGLLEKCQRSTCICDQYDLECTACRNPAHVKYFDRQGKWKYCYADCQGNVQWTFTSIGADGDKQCHLFGCGNGLMPTARQRQVKGKFKDLECKKYKCHGEEDYMISVPIPGNIFWKMFYTDVCIIP